MLETAIAFVSLLAGAVASLSGFGIGSLMTPVLSFAVGTKTAVAAVAVPHFLGTALRFWRLRRHLDRRLLWSFGVTSGAGGLIGAVLHAVVDSPVLTMVFGGLLVFAGAMGLTGYAQRLQFRGVWAWLAGGLSGLLGGLVGNQGGIRSAAMLGFDVPRHAFVATATAVALFVDVARLPVYLYTEGAAVLEIWPLVAISSVGVVIGTLAGERVLGAIPERLFRRLVAGLILALGVLMFWRATL